VKKTTISVTEAARNFADCVNRSHYQNVTFVLLKNGVPFARLVPNHEKICRSEIWPGRWPKPNYRLTRPEPA
jgi:antitoxin (DNA-binding transcriptional repressor) of toxin-antitoxin stability system